MKVSIIFTLFTIVSITSAQTPADPVQFFAQVFRHTGTAEAPIISQTITHGVVTGHRHVVVPAIFVHDLESVREELRVYLQSTALRVSTDIRTVEEIFVHPDFVANNPNVNNIAVLRLSYSDLDTNEIEPRNLGELSTVTCTVYGFEGWSLSLTTAQMTVANTPAACGPNVPFCGIFDLTGFACGGYRGSPVICENQDYVAGIATADLDCNFVEPVLTGRLNLISIGPHAEWIRYVSGAKITTQISLFLITLGVVLGKMLY